MRILFLSAEVSPWSKTGGLGDVSGALPRAMAALGHEVRVVTPLYRSVPRAGLHEEHRPLTLRFPFGEVQVDFRSTPVEGRFAVVFVEAPRAFDRAGLYGFGDDDRRFATLTLGALSWAQSTGFDPDVVWANDWHTALAPLALKTGYAHTALAGARTVFTIHNLAYQGVFAKQELDALGIPWAWFTVEGVEFYDRLSFMKAGLQLSDVLTTVSPSYAQEIQTREGGVGLEGVLRRRRHSLHGILNGVDTAEWNPATDVFLPEPFTAREPGGKQAARRAALAAFGLEAPAPGMPVFGAVGRLVTQKGVDLVLDALPAFLEQGACCVMLGAGEPAYEQALRQLHARFPQRLGVRLGFDNALAHLIEAGSDFFLMPSRFEPCGLNQMYSLLYGAVPIVRAVGGLRDTVRDVARPDGNGVTFEAASAEALFEAMVRATELYRDEARYAQVRARGMAEDFSWANAAKAYEAAIAGA